MSETSIFATDNSGTDTSQNPAPVVPAVPQEVAELVGEGKKYRTVEDALKSVPHAQTHIQKLESELAAKNEALMKAKAVEDLLEEIKKSSVPATPPAVTTTVPSSPPQMDLVKTVDEVVAARLAAQEADRIAQRNTSAVVNAFSAKFGDKGEEEYIRIAQETGLSIQHLNRLAATSPAAVLKLAGIATTQEVSHTPAKTGGSVNTEAFRTNQPAAQPASAKITGTKTSDLVNAWRAAKPT